MPVTIAIATCNYSFGEHLAKCIHATSSKYPHKLFNLDSNTFRLKVLAAW